MSLCLFLWAGDPKKGLTTRLQHLNLLKHCHQPETRCSNIRAWGDISHLNHHPSQIPATHECEGYISNTGTFGEHMKTIADSIVAINSQGPMMQLSIGAHYELHTSPFSAMDSLNIAGCKWHPRSPAKSSCEPHSNMGDMGWHSVSRWKQLGTWCKTSCS